tara:strand:- start:1386 stop:1649 length:264 start_codon:yes stop_codon:yes gene_type:complete
MPDKIITSKDIDIVIEAGFKKNNFDCKVCKLSLSGLQDVESVEAYGMCVDCQELFYWPNMEKCKKGWRPKKEEVHKKLNNYYVVKEK